MIIITHDLGIVAGRTDEVAVMYAGRVVERAPTARLFRHMRMPYTQALLAAIPKVDAAPHSRLPTIPGRPPDLLHGSVGCAFAPRCSLADARCRREAPPLAAPDATGQQYACWRPLEHGPAAARAEPISGVSFGAASH
jgi:peptide/nickel transport system ATP-binding protein